MDKCVKNLKRRALAPWSNICPFSAGSPAASSVPRAFCFPEPCEPGRWGAPPPSGVAPCPRPVRGAGGPAPGLSHPRPGAQGAARGRPTPTGLSAAPGGWKLRESPGGAKKGREQRRAGGRWNRAGVGAERG